MALIASKTAVHTFFTIAFDLTTRERLFHSGRGVNGKHKITPSENGLKGGVDHGGGYAANQVCGLPVCFDYGVQNLGALRPHCEGG